MIADDVQLIQRILSGDDEAFTALVRKYQKSVHALAWRKIGDFHYAEDIMQDTFLQVYKKLPTLKDPRQFAGWLYVITNRRCLNWIRNNRTARQVLETKTVEAFNKSAYSRYVSEQRETESAEARQHIVKQLLEKLPESERTVMTLYYLGEMTTKEIGKFLGVSVNTITSRLQRARKRLRQEEDLLVQEVLGGVQLPATLAENITKKVLDMQPIPTPPTKPLLPWIALGAAAILVLLLLGLSNKYLLRFQKPYSFEAASEPTIEIIEAPVVLETRVKPAPRNQVGRTATAGKISSIGLQGSETASTPKAPVHPEETEPWMPDPALRAAVREALGLPAVVPLTKEHMLDLPHLTAEGKGITDLKGLEFARNLSHLHLGDAGNYVTDLSPIATLTALRYLNVGSNRVADVKPLMNLTHLTGLSLWHNQVTDISPLRSLTALTYLNLADNYVSDLRPLAHLINLKKLDLFDNEVVNIAPLADLKNLNHLILTENHIQNLRPLVGLTQLQALWIKQNPITDFRPLSELTNLTDLKYDAIPDPTARTQPSEAWMPDPALRAAIRGELGLLPEVSLTKEALLRLDYLDAQDKGILDITGLAFATNLRELHLGMNPITDLRPLANLTSLVSLHIWRISPRLPNLDIRPLANLTNLEFLSLAQNMISDISPLANLKKLRRLHLRHNQIVDLRPLAGLTQLWELAIEGNPITDLTALSELNLRELDISNNPRIDLRPLAHIRSLEGLFLERSRITDIRPLSGLRNLRILDIRYNDIEDLRPLSGLTALQTLLIQGNPITDLTPLSSLNLTNLKYDAVPEPTQETDTAAVWMPDPALRSFVRGELGLLPDVPLTKERILQLQVLNATEKGIHNITGLEFATNLRELDLNRNPITDLQPLADLTKLHSLHLSGISKNVPNLDLRPLAAIINLERLSLENNQISDVSPLAGLKRLQTLDIRYNAIENIQPLAGLVALRRLWIQGNLIGDFSSLSGLPLTDFRTSEENTQLSNR